MIEKYVDMEELKRLLSSLLVMVGALVIGGLFAMIVVPGLRNANRPQEPTPVNPVVGQPGWLDPTEFPPMRGREVPPVDPKTLLTVSPELVAKGKALFERNCVACHGVDGRGDGPASGTMSPRPRNFTSPDGWTNGYTLPAIFKTLTEGVKGTSMSPFDYLSRTDRIELAHYVRSLGSFPHGQADPAAIAALSKELASPGGRTPNRIPVSMAMAKLEGEYASPPPLEVDPADHGAGAEVLRRVVTDPGRAGRTLAGTRSWRSGPVDLAAVILPGIPANGFAADIATLNAAEWRELYGKLLEELPPALEKEEK